MGLDAMVFCDWVEKHRTASDRCPVLLNKVLYSGSHTGDYLSHAKTKKRIVELHELRSPWSRYNTQEEGSVILGMCKDLEEL